MPSPVPLDLAAACSGDHAAFTRLVEALHHDLRVFIAAHAVNREQLEEICQATWVVVWQRIGQWREEAPFDHWLRGIARNLLREDLRRRARVATLAQAGVLDSIMVDDGIAHIDDADQRRRARLPACLEQLTPRARTLLLARDQDSQPLAELAQRFKQPMGALATMLWRIRSTMRACIEGGGA
jgi:RNA polymerase sigma-70 factor (ECF subfamily)